LPAKRMRSCDEVGVGTVAAGASLALSGIVLSSQS
jgi:hypothetical protein